MIKILHINDFNPANESIFIICQTDGPNFQKWNLDEVLHFLTTYRDAIERTEYRKISYSKTRVDEYFKTYDSLISDCMVNLINCEYDDFIQPYVFDTVWEAAI